MELTSGTLEVGVPAKERRRPTTRILAVGLAVVKRGCLCFNQLSFDQLQCRGGRSELEEDLRNDVRPNRWRRGRADRATETAFRASLVRFGVSSEQK